MDTSKLVAVAVALERLGHDVEVTRPAPSCEPFEDGPAAKALSSTT